MYQGPRFTGLRGNAPQPDFGHVLPFWQHNVSPAEALTEARETARHYAPHLRRVVVRTEMATYFRVRMHA